MDNWPILVSLSKPDGPQEKCKETIKILTALVSPIDGGYLAKQKEKAKWAQSKKGKAESQLAILRQHKTAFLDSLQVAHASV